MYPSDINFSIFNSLIVRETKVYTFCDVNTGEVVESETVQFENDNPVSNYVNLQCYCDLGSIPNTYGDDNVRFTLSDKSITCYDSWELSYQWSTADFDGSNEIIVADQTSKSFSAEITNADAF